MTKDRKERCAQWDGQQCRATKDLQGVVVHPVKGNWLEVPEKVVVQLCPKHFEMRRTVRPAEAQDALDSEVDNTDGQLDDYTIVRFIRKT